MTRPRRFVPRAGATSSRPAAGDAMTARDQLTAIVLFVNATQRKLADVGNVIRRAREDAGQTQQQLADRLGVRQVDISRWESGRVVPSGITLGRIAQALR